MLPRFRRVVPHSSEEALVCWRELGGMFCAGGQALLMEMALGRRVPDVLVDLSLLEPADAAARDGLVELDSLSTLDSLESRPEVPPLLRDAARAVGFPSIRSRATIVGNLCHGLPTGEMSLALVALQGAVHGVLSDGTATTKTGDSIFDLRPVGDRSELFIRSISWARPRASTNADLYEVGEQGSWLPALSLATMVTPRPDGTAAVSAAVGLRDGGGTAHLEFALPAEASAGDLRELIGGAIRAADRLDCGRQGDWVTDVVSARVADTRQRSGGP